MTLSRTVKTQWTQRLRFCFRARQPCERNFKRPQGQELSTELDRHERTKLRRWRTERHVPPRSDPVNSDANANLIAILGAIPGLIQSLGSLCIWTLDEIGRSMESMEPIPPFCSISLCGFSAVCCWKTLLFLDWTWLNFGFDWWILDDLGWSWAEVIAGSSRAVATMTACGCLAWIFLGLLCAEHCIACIAGGFRMVSRCFGVLKRSD